MGWENYKIDFSDLVKNGNPAIPFDPENCNAMIISGAGDFNVPGEMWIDNIRFISKNEMSPIVPADPPNPLVSHLAKVNQLGYLPSAFKEFSVTADSFSANQPFFIFDKNLSEVYSGNLGSASVDDSDISEEQVFKGNFSDFESTGIFRIKTGNKTSFPFQVGELVYDSLLFY